MRNKFKTYPVMNEKIVELLRLADEGSIQHYAADRIEELEKACLETIKNCTYCVDGLVDNSEILGIVDEDVCPKCGQARHVMRKKD